MTKPPKGWSAECWNAAMANANRAADPKQFVPCWKKNKVDIKAMLLKVHKKKGEVSK